MPTAILPLQRYGKIITMTKNNSYHQDGLYQLILKGKLPECFSFELSSHEYMFFNSSNPLLLKVDPDMPRIKMMSIFHMASLTINSKEANKTEINDTC